MIVAELGDFNPEEHKDRYLSEFRFLPSQSPEFYTYLTCIVVIVAELGDFNPEEHKDRYLSEFRFLPSQSPEFENEVALLHKQHRYVKGFVYIGTKATSLPDGFIANPI